MTIQPLQQRSPDEDASLLINAAHAQLMAFATASYAAEGRGVIHVAIPPLRPGAPAVIDTTMVYFTLDHLRQLVGGLSARERADSCALMDVVESYDPHHEALVSVEVGSRTPVTIVMELAQSVVPEQVAGIH